VGSTFALGRASKSARVSHASPCARAQARTIWLDTAAAGQPTWCTTCTINSSISVSVSCSVSSPRRSAASVCSLPNCMAR
jgi:hypothetical protein